MLLVGRDLASGGESKISPLAAFGFCNVSLDTTRYLANHGLLAGSHDKGDLWYAGLLELSAVCSDDWREVKSGDSKYVGGWKLSPLFLADWNAASHPAKCFSKNLCSFSYRASQQVRDIQSVS